MTNVIDKRATERNTIFEDLKIGDFFEVAMGSNDISIKTGVCTAMYYTGGSWIPFCVDKEELVIPLKATITVERGEEKK